MPSLFDVLSGGKYKSDVDLQSAAVDMSNRAGVGQGGNIGNALNGMDIDLQERPDLAKHALMSQAVADKFGPNIAKGVGLGKEALDFFGQAVGGGGPDQDDMTANQIGINNSNGSFGSFMQDLFVKPKEDMGGNAGGAIVKPHAFAGIRG
jgi:hypothetical protein